MDRRSFLAVLSCVQFLRRQPELVPLPQGFYKATVVSVNDIYGGATGETRRIMKIALHAKNYGASPTTIRRLTQKPVAAHRAVPR